MELGHEIQKNSFTGGNLKLKDPGQRKNGCAYYVEQCWSGRPNRTSLRTNLIGRPDESFTRTEVLASKTAWKYGLGNYLVEVGLWLPAQVLRVLKGPKASESCRRCGELRPTLVEPQDSVVV